MDADELAKEIQLLDERIRALQTALARQEQTVNTWFARAAEMLSALGEQIQVTTQHASVAEARSRQTLATMQGQVLALLGALAREDAVNRRQLWVARESPDYERPFNTPNPLISVVVPTGGRPETLRERVLPSLLRQTHENVEVVVVGNSVSPLTADAVLSVKDERLSFVNLTQHVPEQADHQKDQIVMPANEGVRIARGDWTLVFDDQHEMYPGALAQLLGAAREARAEAVYGRVREVSVDPNLPGSELVGTFPPQVGSLVDPATGPRFSLGTLLRHRALSFFDLQYSAFALQQRPEDFLVESMLRAGVRFTMIPQAIFDHELVRPVR
jgi:uncharacterized membrane-anchored protein YhcB (DUF1043 family)